MPHSENCSLMSSGEMANMKHALSALTYSYFTVQQCDIVCCILPSLLWCIEIVMYWDDIVSVIARWGTGGYEGINLSWWMQYVMSRDQDSERMLVTVMTIQTTFPRVSGRPRMWYCGVCGEHNQGHGWVGAVTAVQGAAYCNQHLNNSSAWTRRN